jgi:hypothetical protein
MHSVENHPMFRKNMIPSSSGSKNKPSMKQVTNPIFWDIYCTLHSGLSHDIFFDPEDGGDMSHRCENFRFNLVRIEFM